MTGRLSFHSSVRCTQRIAILAFAMAASALADGSGAVALAAPGATFSNEAEAALVRALTGLREHGLKTAMLEVDKLLARNPTTSRPAIAATCARFGLGDALARLLAWA